MIRIACLQEGSLTVGNIVEIDTNRVDLAKISCKNLTLIVVEKRPFKKNSPMRCSTNKLFQMQPLYGTGAIAIIKDLN